MKKIFVFADFHCHPTLKTYGHTFENSKYGYKRRNIWFKQNNSFLRKLICQFVGLTKFSQADFTTLKQGNVKIVTASLYPFEKGFFINLAGRGSVSAFLANIITGISYYRIRNIQKHTNYFQDLEKEYLFLIEAVSNDNKNILFFPTKKEEAWKYTSLNAILKNDFSVFPKSEHAIEFKDVKKYFLHDVDTYKLVFVDGKFSSFLSSTTHDGIDVCLMSSALTKPKYKMVVDEYFNKIASKEEILTTLNSAKF